MVKDFLVSFKDNFNEKSRNPFLGTYLLVWFIRNWELVYTLFNFDSDKKLIDKIQFVKDYYHKNEFIDNLLINILWALGLLILTYFLLNISRFIVNLSEKQITPWIYKTTDSKSIVLIDVYNKVRDQVDSLQLKLNKERDSKNLLEARIDSLESELLKISTNKNEVKDDNFEDLDSSSIYIKKLKKKDLIQAFLSTTVTINKGNSLSNDYDPKDYFVELGLIQFTENSYDGRSKSYAITEDGEKVLKKLRIMEY